MSPPSNILLLSPNERSVDFMEDVADKKKAIFESTLELVREHGFHGTPMSMVARKAGVATGTIYHYFESKDELICELYSYSRNRVSEVIRQELEQEGSFQEKFHKVWMSLYHYYVSHTNVLLFFEQYVNSPYNMAKCPSRFHSELETFLRSGTESGVIRDMKSEILVSLTLSSIISAAKLHRFARVPLTDHDLNQITETLWTGMVLH